MPADPAAKAAIVSLVEDLYASDPVKYAGLRAAVGDQGDSAPYNTVTVNGATLLVGTAWTGGPLDPDNPAAGPDPDLVNNTPLALMALTIAQAAAGTIISDVSPNANDDADDG